MKTFKATSVINGEQEKKIKLPRKRKKLFKKEQSHKDDYWVTCIAMEVMRTEPTHIPNFRTKFHRRVEYYNPRNPVSIKRVIEWY